jgi:hypothetical protein
MSLCAIYEHDLHRAQNHAKTTAFAKMVLT